MATDLSSLPVAIPTVSRWRDSRWARWLTPKQLVLVGVTLVVAYLALTPLILLVYRMLTDADGLFTLDNVLRAYRDPTSVTLLRNSFVFALGATALSMIFGTGLAYLHARTDISFKPALFAASVVPLVIPGLLYTVAWITLASPRSGLINQLTDTAFGQQPLDVFGMAGMIWVESTQLAPLVFLLMVAAFRSMDPSLEESALVSGASGWTVMRRITFPLVRRAFLAAALIMIVRCLESFEVPALLGMPGGTWVFTSQIWDEMNRYPSDIGGASAYSSVLLLIAVAGIVLHNWLARRGGDRAAQTIGGKAFRARPRAITGVPRVLANTLVLLFVVVVVLLPAVALVYASLLRTTKVPSLDVIESMSLFNYTSVLANPAVTEGAKNSLILSIGTATGTMLLMSLVSWIVLRSKAVGRGLLDGLSFLPMTFPGIVLGLSLLFVYLRVPLPIYGTLGILFVAYVTKYMPYGLRYSSVSMNQISNELEESAMVSGATWWQTFRRVMLPLLTPGIMAGWIYIAIISVRELSSSLLIYSPGHQPLAVAMWTIYQNGDINKLAALGVLLMLALTLLVLVAYRIGARVGVHTDESIAA